MAAEQQQTDAEYYAANPRSIHRRPIYRTVFDHYTPDAVVRLTFSDGSTIDYKKSDNQEVYRYHARLAMGKRR